MARTQEQRKAETRRRLLDAARDLIATEGFDAVSVDAIGDAAERTSGSVYAHFGGKHGLLLAILEDFEGDLAAVVEAEFVALPDLPSRLAALWRNVASHPSLGGSSWLLLEHELWLKAARDDEAADSLRQRYRTIRQLMRDEFASWVVEFDLEPAVDVDAIPQVVFATLAGLEMQHRVDPDAVPDHVAVGTLLSLFGAPRSRP